MDHRDCKLPECTIDDQAVDVRPLVEDSFGKERALRQIREAITKAVTDEEIVWLTDGDGGRRVGALVPAEVAESFVAMMERELTDLSGLVRQIRGGSWEEAPDCKLAGIGAHEANAVIARPTALLPHAHWCGNLKAGHSAFMDVLRSSERVTAARHRGADPDAALRT